MSDTTTINTESIILEALSNSVRERILADDGIVVVNHGLPPAQISKLTHSHSDFEIRFLFNTTSDGQADYSSLIQIALTPPETLHNSAEPKLRSTFLGMLISEQNIFYLRSGGTLFSLRHIPWLEQEEKYGASIRAMRKGFDQYSSGEWNSQFHLASMISFLLSMLAMAFQEKQCTSSKLSPAYNISEYIRQYYHRTDLSIAEISRTMHYSPNYIQQIFRKEYNCSPIAYLKETRLIAAQKLLEKHQYRIKEIAALCGWKYVHYFDKCYREHFGHSPTEE